MTYWIYQVLIPLVFACSPNPEEIIVPGTSFESIGFIGGCSLTIKIQEDFIFSSASNKNKFCLIASEQGPAQIVCDLQSTSVSESLRQKIEDSKRIRNSRGELIGLLEFELGSYPKKLVLWSVNRKGQKDKSSPYLEVRAENPSLWKISAIQNNKEMGQIEATSLSPCTSAPRPSQGKISLKDRRFRTDWTSCSGGLKEVDSGEQKRGGKKTGGAR